MPLLSYRSDTDIRLRDGGLLAVRKPGGYLLQREGAAVAMLVVEGASDRLLRDMLDTPPATELLVVRNHPDGRPAEYATIDVVAPGVLR